MGNVTQVIYGDMVIPIDPASRLSDILTEYERSISFKIDGQFDACDVSSSCSQQSLVKDAFFLALEQSGSYTGEEIRLYGRYFELREWVKGFRAFVDGLERERLSGSSDESLKVRPYDYDLLEKAYMKAHNTRPIEDAQALVDELFTVTFSMASGGVLLPDLAERKSVGVDDIVIGERKERVAKIHVTGFDYKEWDIPELFRGDIRQVVDMYIESANRLFRYEEIVKEPVLGGWCSGDDPDDVIRLENVPRLTVIGQGAYHTHYITYESE